MKICHLVKLTLVFGLLLGSTGLVKAASKKGLQPQLALSPSRVEIKADDINKTQSITVLNLGSTSMDVEVSVQNWDFDEDNNYRALAPTPQSLDQWLIINPVRIKVPAKGQQTVRMAVRPKAKPDAGEHRAMVFFRQVHGSENAKGVNVKFNVGVPVYAYFGDVEQKATLHSMQLLKTNNELSFDVSNEGNAYVRPQGYFMIVPEDNKDSDTVLLSRLNAETGEVSSMEPVSKGRFSAKPIFAGERRSVRALLSTDEELPQSYRLAVKANVAGTTFEKVYIIQKDK